MQDHDFDAFFRELLGRYDYSWQGYRKVRRRLRKRLRRRLRELGLDSWSGYLAHLDSSGEERASLPTRLAVPISRFFRDREAWFQLAAVALPRLPPGPGAVPLCTSLGCASGEEPLTLAMLASEHGLDDLEILGIDIRPEAIERAERGEFPGSALRDVPVEFRERFFRARGESYHLVDDIRDRVRFLVADCCTAEGVPEESSLILSRYATFTYRGETSRRAFLDLIRGRLLPGGFLMLGSIDRPPDPITGFESLGGGIFRRSAR